MTPVLQLRIPLGSLVLLLLCANAQYTPIPRWGQATVLVDNVLFVYGGKTDQFNAFSYTSALTTNDLLLLDLSATFDAAAPPWQYVSGTQNASSAQGPALAWHTLAAYNTSQILVFGGDGGPNSPIVLPNQEDSASLLDVSDHLQPIWIPEAQSWAGEPQRRVHHAVASLSGLVWIIGGEKTDGSGLGYPDHYAFDPSIPSFTQLPPGGPPDIFGHTAIVLSTGRIVIFGGYIPSQSQLVPLTTLWILDTTQSPVTWTMASVSGDAVPLARRAFAAVLLDGDKILIQGGADAELQTTYSDGWILDTTASPMTWSNVSTMTQLGPRRDHLAVSLGSVVLFDFGYALDAGAPASMSVYDVVSNSFIPSFTPPNAHSSHTTLPGSSKTAGHSSTHGAPTHTPSTPANPPEGSNPSPAGASSRRNVTAITLGSIFGFFALVVGGSAVYVYHRRQHLQHGRFRLLLGGDDAPSPSSATGGGSGRVEKVRMAGAGWGGEGGHGWSLFGGRTRGGSGAGLQGRLDILAEEDVREFGSVRRHGSGSSRSWYSGSYSYERGASGGQRLTLGDVVAGSWASLRSVGVMLAGSTRGKGVRDSEWWEKDDVPLDPFTERDEPSDEDVHVTPAGVALRDAAGGLEASEGGSLAYTDPFDDKHDQHDRLPEVMYDAGSDGDDEHSEHHASSHSHTQWGSMRGSIHSSHSPLSKDSALAPLATVSSRGTGSSLGPDRHTSASSHGAPGSLFSAHRVSSFSSQDIPAPTSPSPPAPTLAPSASLSRNRSARPHTTSIVGASTAPSRPIRRSDSWWARFKRTSFREGPLSVSSSSGDEPRVLDFRDPNPAPRLSAIREASASQSVSAESPDAQAVARRALYGSEDRQAHARSFSSLRTSRTVDSDAIERMGRRMDVVRRDGTMSSDRTTPSTASTMDEGQWVTNGRPLSNITSSGQSGSMLESTESEHGSLMESPTEEGAPQLPSPMSPLAAYLPPPRLDNAGDVRPPPQRKATGGAVAARIAEFERRASVDVAPTSPLFSPRLPTPPDALKKRKASVNYGLVPRPELFVANPDKTRQTSDP